MDGDGWFTPTSKDASLAAMNGGKIPTPRRFARLQSAVLSARPWIAMGVRASRGSSELQIDERRPKRISHNEVWMLAVT
jgi:hypothetical protein